MTSPLERVPSAHQVMRLTESLMNLTEPSPNATLTPPECQLEAGAEKPLSSQAWLAAFRQPFPLNWASFGVWKWLNIDSPRQPWSQRMPRVPARFPGVNLAEQVARSFKMALVLM